MARLSIIFALAVLQLGCGFLFSRLQERPKEPGWGLTTVWEYPASGPVIKLLVEDQTLYLLTADQLDLLEVSTGNSVGSIPGRASPWSDFVAHNNIVVVRDENGRLYPFRRDRELLPEHSFDLSEDAASMLLTSEVLLVAHHTDTLTAYNLEAGAILWEEKFPSRILSLSQDESVYVGTESGRLHAVNPLSGRIGWVLDLSGPMASKTTSSGRWMFLGDDGNSFYSVGRKKGKVRWKLRTGGDVRSRPLVHEGIVYIASYDNTLYALQVRNGYRVWDEILPNRPILDGLIVHEVLLLATFPSRRIELLYLKDGRSGGSYELDEKADYVTASPVSDGDRIYVGTYKGTVLALELSRLAGSESGVGG